MALVEHVEGNYRFLPGIAPYSCGVVACPGFEIVQVTLSEPIAYRLGFQRIAEFLANAQRPKAALCALALRSPQPFSFEGFRQLNTEYTAILESWGLFVDGVNPVARTNIAPVMLSPDEPALYSFSYTRPCADLVRPTFVVAGAGELPEGVLARDAIVALGDVSQEGMLIKSTYVMDLMETRLVGLGGRWSHVTHVNVYTAQLLPSLITDIVLPRAKTANRDGIVWHYSRPPIEEIEFEMDMRATVHEVRDF